MILVSVCVVSVVSIWPAVNGGPNLHYRQNNVQTLIQQEPLDNVSSLERIYVIQLTKDFQRLFHYLLGVWVDILRIYSPLFPTNPRIKTPSPH